MMSTESSSDDSVISWLGLGPGKIKIDHVKALINEIMAVSTLLSGFSIGMSAKITDAAIHSYAEFLKAEFFGKDSHYCTFDAGANLPGSRPLSELPAYDVNNPSQKNSDNAYCSEDSSCWVGHWATISAGTELGFAPCSLSVDEVKAAYPDYWERTVMEKVASVQLELGANTMTIIMTTVAVVSLGSLLRLSLIKRYDAAEAWLARFYPLVVVLACLPLFNFYNFLQLASRVMRVLWYYCDDYITTECMVTNTPGFENMKKLLLTAGTIVWLLHISIPRHIPSQPATGAKSAAAAAAPSASQPPPATIDEKLQNLIRMRAEGSLTEGEFHAAKAMLLQAAAEASTPKLAVGVPPKVSTPTSAAGYRMMEMSSNASAVGGADS
jgi:hypothetical protein